MTSLSFKTGAAFNSALVGVALVVCLPLAVTADHHLSEQQAAAHEPFALVGGRVLLPDGTLGEDLAVVVEAGRIQAIVAADKEDLPTRTTLPEESVLSPGLIDVGSSLGAFGQLSEPASVINPNAEARHALDLYDERWEKALQAGVTSALVCPTPANLVCGRAALVRAAAPESEKLFAVIRPGPLVFALSDAVLRPTREPTSRSGARHRLQDALRRAHRSNSADEAPFREIKRFLEGESMGLLFCDDLQDASGVLSLFEQYGQAPHVALRLDEPLADVATLVERLKQAERMVVLGPFDFSASERTLRSAAALEQAGAEIVLAGGLPGRAGFSPRLTAALAVRQGMDPSAARRPITSAAARLAGAADLLGAIEAAKAADLVVFSEDPLRLDARVRTVFVAGQTVYRGQP